MTPRAVAAALIALGLGVAPAADAAPKPKRPQVQYSLDQLGFNEGAPYRLRGAEAEAVLADPGAALFAFESDHWMEKSERGAYVRLGDVVGRLPERSPSDLVAVYQLDFDGDRVPEFLLVAQAALVDTRHRYAPTILKLGQAGQQPLWAASALPGERYAVLDIRDLNADGRPEVLLSGESGQSGFYQFTSLVGHGKRGVVTLSVDHVDSLHYVDLDNDGRVEIVHRRRVGRRGPAHQWTYVDHLHRWDGQRFAKADEVFPRYHDEQTLPALIGELIDHYTAKAPILDEKVDAIEEVRRQVLSWTKRPRGYHAKKVKALQELARRNLATARARLEELDDAYPYDAQVLLGLAQVHGADQRWESVLDVAIRALTVEPRDRGGWWWAGVALSQLSERSSAVASFYSAVSLCGGKDEGLAFLRARRGEPGMEAALQEAIDQALRELEQR